MSNSKAVSVNSNTVTTSKTATPKAPSVQAVALAAKKQAEVKAKNWADQMALITAAQAVEVKEAAEAKAKVQAAKKKPGVILNILSVITDAKKPVTEEQILSKLVAAFPKREEKSMRSTIKAQIGGKKRPLRMEQEKTVIFNIVVNAAGVKSFSIA